MDIGVSEALDLARRWERNATAIKGSVFTDSQELRINFAGCISVDDDQIVLTSEGGMQLTITLLREMTIKYGQSVLEIRHSGYRCILYEPRD